MKKTKIISIVILTFVIIFQTACSKVSRSWDAFSNETGNILPTEFTYDHSDDMSTHQMSMHMISHNGYIYYHDGTSFVQYNEKTGNRSYLCPRVNCNHKDTSCTFRSSMISTSLYAKDNKLFFWRDFDDGNKLVTYDIITGKQTVLHSMTQTDAFASTSVFFFDPYLYYYEITTVDNEGEYQIGDVVLFRQHIETLNIDTVYTFDDYEGGNVIADRGDSLILTRNDGIFSLSLSNTPDRKILVNKDMLENQSCLSTSCYMKDGYLWFFSCSDDPNDQTSALWKYSLENAELTKLADINGTIDALNHSFTSDYIYFRTRGERNIGHFKSDSGANSGELIIEQPNFYRISYDGGEPQEVLREFPNYASTCNIIGEFCVDGNYIYARYNNYGPELKDEYTMEDFSGSLSGLMRIDIRDESIIYVSGK